MGRIEKLLEWVKAKAVPALPAAPMLCPDPGVHNPPVPTRPESCRTEAAALGVKVVTESFSDPSAGHAHWVLPGPLAGQVAKEAKALTDNVSPSAVCLQQNGPASPP